MAREQSWQWEHFYKGSSKVNSTHWAALCIFYTAAALARLQDKERKAVADGILEAERSKDILIVEVTTLGKTAYTSAITPLPKLQLFLLLYLQLAEPITSTVIYPFVNQLVRETGVTGDNEKKTGYFAGIIESSFYMTEAICVMQWGRISDRIGRKPVLLGGLFGLSLSMVGFGLSRTYWALILSRCAAGALNGNIGVVKGMMAEITDVTNRAQGFAFLVMIWSIGGTIGPIVGGVLARPADRWPDAFRSNFWARYPYFLPCIVTAAISISAFTIALVGLKETLSVFVELPKFRTKQSNPSCVLGHDKEVVTISLESGAPYTSGENVIAVFSSSSTAALNNFDVESSTEIEQTDMETAPTTAIGHLGIRSILIAPILLPILNYAFLAYVDQCFQVILPLMYSTSIAEGGLGFSSFTIGVIMGVWGIINGMIQILAFPWMHEKLGTRRLYIASYASFLLCISAFALLGHLTKRSEAVTARSWAIIVLQLAAYSLTSMTWGCIFLYINDSVSERTLGLTNGLAQTTASAMRAIAPSSSSSLFSLSLEANLAGGTAVYWILCAVVVGGILASTLLPRELRSRSQGVILA